MSTAQKLQSTPGVRACVAPFVARPDQNEFRPGRATSRSASKKKKIVRSCLTGLSITRPLGFRHLSHQKPPGLSPVLFTNRIHSFDKERRYIDTHPPPTSKEPSCLLAYSPHLSIWSKPLCSHPLWWINQVPTDLPLLPQDHRTFSEHGIINLPELEPALASVP